MALEGFLLIAGPLAIYGFLVLLPSSPGYPIAGLLGSLCAVAFLAAALTRPSPRYVDLVPFIATLIATLALSATLGAFGYHAVARRRGPSWWLRLLFLLLAGAFGWALFSAYAELT
jgi:hypothetical protein